MQKSSSNIVPKKLIFEIGGYDSSSYSLELKGDRLKYNDGYVPVIRDENFFKPSDKEWIQLRKDLDKVGVWNWSRQYESDVLDGTQWSFEVSYEDNSIKIYGNNAYPDPENVSEGVVLEFTEPFMDLINALKNITSDECFNIS